ncbi:efflux transporter outer membrane subunit [Sphingomonas jatrophae]|uniref:efflux transporter outer membrane subunit n=1 Tax=Sphingomonas jatrophae TaxID=1166337 RepID=UPI001F610C30|nr:efflux transporter outer membrane subunit [Sphingomonas jatrophae]
MLPLAVAALMGGCAAVPDLGPTPTPATPARFATTQSLAGPVAAWPEDRWWQSLGDPQLAQLVEEALVASPDLASADARLRRAQGLAEQAGAARLPTLSATATPELAKQSYNNGIPAQFVPKGWNDYGRATIDLRYELDFFGRNRAAFRAATSERQAAEVEARAARLAVAASVAEAYADLARLFAERDAAEATLRVRGETASLVRRRVENGLDTRGEQSQAEAGVRAARAQLAAGDEAIALTRNRLAALLGAGPDRGLAIARPPRIAPRADGLPPSLALDLVGRRADIVAARLRAEAAAQRIKVARANFYPNVNLAALIGVQSLGLDNIVRSGSTIGSVAPAISLPIFQGGRLSGQYREARGDYDAAVALYDQTLTRALNEVADAAASRRALATRLAETRAAVAASEDAYRIARQRYEGGLSTFLNVLSAEDALTQNRRLLAELDARALALDVQLIRALGGGFAA